MQKKALFILSPQAFDSIYGEPLLAEVRSLVDVLAPPLTAADAQKCPDLLAQVQVLFSGWGSPRLDEDFLRAAPELEAVFYGAGSVRPLVTDAVWERGVRISSAWELNAIPVAEFTFAQILFSLKRGWLHLTQALAGGEGALQRHAVPGAYRSKVGIIALGAVGRRVCELLRVTDLEVLAHDPFAPNEVFHSLNARPVDLDTLFAECEVVSLHAPNLPATRRMIRGRHLERMKPGGTFINTARGDVVHEPELVEVLTRRPDLWAALDVLAEEDRSERAALLSLPNVIFTPHIAGSMGGECRRMGEAMVDELRRYLAGEPLQRQVTRDLFEQMA